MDKESETLFTELKLFSYTQSGGFAHFFAVIYIKFILITILTQDKIIVKMVITPETLLTN